ncbi:MAG TPA: hypothetical protein PK668_09530 [Myxococcota bacterium]|nr:hypothetical protein [Myxococcota bacterium]HRY92777.1 hypothetical protein [Myxococcota bacterium]HSA20428.1 hypothetical protein [Myxococcota bacterium]
MSTKKWAALLSLSFVAFGAGCTYRYTIQPEEAARAASDLTRLEETQVRARSADGRSVIVRLERGARLYPMDAAGNCLDDGGLLSGQGDALASGGSVSQVEYNHFNRGVPLLAGGLGGFLLGAVLQAIYALDEPEYAIPLAGPVLAMQHNFTYEQPYRECESGVFCYQGTSEGTHRLAGIGNLFTMIFQVAGLGVAIGGVIAWDGSPELGPAGEQASAGDLSFTLEPVAYGDGGGGGAFTLRF